MSPFILIIFSIIIISMLILTISMTILTIKLVIHIMFIRWSLWSSSCSSGGWRALWRAVPLVGCKGSWAMAWTRGFSSFFFFYVICHAITCRYLDWAMAWTNSFFYHYILLCVKYYDYMSFRAMSFSRAIQYFVMKKVTSNFVNEFQRRKKTIWSVF